MLTPVSFYNCLSEDTRLKCLLLIAQLGELCVCDMIVALELSQPKVSRHLAELRKCGLLQDERRGKWVYYTLHPALPEWATKVLSLTASNNNDYLMANLTLLKQIKPAANNCC